MGSTHLRPALSALEKDRTVVTFYFLSNLSVIDWQKEQLHTAALPSEENPNKHSYFSFMDPRESDMGGNIGVALSGRLALTTENSSMQNIKMFTDEQIDAEEVRSCMKIPSHNRGSTAVCLQCESSDASREPI